MEAEPGVFQAFYDGALQHPWLLWAAALAALARVGTLADLDPGVRRYCAALGVLSLLDAWLTANHVYGVGAFSGALASAVPLFFVLAGDFRFLLLVTSGTPGGTLRFGVGSVAAAAGLTLVVPVASQLVLSALPDAWDTPRMLFWVYEVAFVGLTLGLLRLYPGLRENAWLRRVSHFVLLYYTLWALADSAILGLGADWGFALRVVPNVLYYGGLVAAIASFAPRPASSTG